MKLTWTIFFILLFIRANTQDLKLYQAYAFVSSDQLTLPYRILYPENYDKRKKYPLVLFLHGAGERGDDNKKQLVHGARLFLEESNRKKFPCIVLAPQCPTEGYWGSVDVDRSSMPRGLDFDYRRAPTPALKAAMELLQQVIQDEGVDKSRLYITGLSMGGMGTFEAVFRYPRVFAAALPICGGGDVQRYNRKVKRVPFWVFHGDSDAVVDVEHSRNMVKKLKDLSINVKYSEYPGVNHNSWDNAFAEPDFLSWMFAQKGKKAKFKEYRPK